MCSWIERWRNDSMDQSRSIDSVISTFHGLLREKRQSCTIGKANWRTLIPIMRSISDGCLRFYDSGGIQLRCLSLFSSSTGTPACFPLGLEGFCTHCSNDRNSIGLLDVSRPTRCGRGNTPAAKGTRHVWWHLPKHSSPQAVSEFPFWWVISFLVDSPFLVLFSFLYIPVWYYICCAEEKDLLIRYGDSYADYMKRVGFWFPKR